MLSRLAALAGPLLILLVFTVGGFVGVVRYTSVFNPAIGVGGSMPSHASLHRGPTPCLRYPVAPKPGSAREAAEALAAAGLSSSDFSDLTSESYARAAAQETSLHLLSEVDEYLQEMSRNSTLLSRMIITLRKDLLREQLAAIVTMGAVKYRRPGALTIASLPPAQRAAYEAQWSRDPSVFVLPGLIELARSLRISNTERRLDAVLADLEAQVARGEEPRLGAVRVSIEDGWGSPFTLERTSSEELTLTSLGNDRAEGGSSFDADLTRTLHTRPTPEAPLPACEGKTSISIRRSEFDAVLENLAAASSSVRVIPAVEDGVVTGFRLKNLKPDSFLVHAGLCEGDVVSTLNGFSLTAPDKALEVYSAMKKATRVEVKLIRKNEPVTIAVKLTR